MAKVLPGNINPCEKNCRNQPFLKDVNDEDRFLPHSR